jgi:hypothetical protein
VASEPAVNFPGRIAGVKVNQSGGGEGVVIIKVPTVYLEKMLALGLFMGAFFEDIAFYAPSKMEEL